MTHFLLWSLSRIKIELHFSLIAAAVTYIMWKNVGNDKIQKMEGGGKKLKSADSNVRMDPKKQRGYWRVDCQSASKGLFLGLLCLVGGIIILIIFFVMKVCMWYWIACKWRLILAVPYLGWLSVFLLQFGGLTWLLKWWYWTEFQNRVLAFLVPHR